MANQTASFVGATRLGLERADQSMAMWVSKSGMVESAPSHSVDLTTRTRRLPVDKACLLLCMTLCQDFNPTGLAGVEISRPVCVIVGAGEGLGRALAARFAKEGFDIGLVSRSQTGAREAVESARAADAMAQVLYLAADANRPETIEEALAAVARDLGEVEVLIYNVRGRFTRCEPLAMTYTQLEEIFRTEVVGAFAAARSVIPAMQARGHGSVLFSSATAALRGSAAFPLYAIGKFGLRALSQGLAKAYAKDGVHVAHVRLDCDLDVPVMRQLYGNDYDPAMLANPDDVARTYWWVHQQPRSAWSNEVELRPFTETWTL